MVTRAQLNQYVDLAPPGKALVYGMAVALVLGLIHGDDEDVEKQRQALEAAGYTGVEIDREGWEARMRYINIMQNHGPLEDDADVQA